MFAAPTSIGAGCLAAGVVAWLTAAPAAMVQDVRFTDVTPETGITFSHASSLDKRYLLESMSGGVALFDFDRDGLIDVYFVNAPTVATAADPRSARSELWRNRGDGTFADITDRAGVGYPGWGMGVAVADIDNDGWDDLYVTCYGRNRLYRNNGDGTFSDIAARAGVDDPRWSTGAAFADYDGDGWLDLFVANYVDMRLDALPRFGEGPFCQFRGIPVQCGPPGLPGAPDALYRNRGDGTFEDVTAKAGVAGSVPRYGLGVVWQDFDGDGRPDVFVANDAGPNFLYRNNGDGTFTDLGLRSGTALSENGKPQGSMGIAVGDYDRSGGWSLLVTNFADEYNALYRHGRGFLFTDASFPSRTARPSLPFVGWGTHLFDYDNDGWLDLFVVNGHVYPQVTPATGGAGYRQPKLLYRNNRDGTFTASAGPAFAALAVGRGSAAGDLDNDGDLDVVINNLDGGPTVLRNDGGNRGHFVVIDLEQRGRNRRAIGAVVSVTTGGMVQRAARRSGDSYLSHSDGRLHFGIGAHTRVDAIEVTWPGGAVQRFGGVPANAFLRIVEGLDTPRVVWAAKGAAPKTSVRPPAIVPGMRSSD